MPTQFLNNEAMIDAPAQMKDLTFQRSEVMQEIVSDKPGFLIRWGNIFFLFILLMTGIACWFIKYPDTIQAPAKLTSINAPKPVLSLIDGKLIKLSIAENQFVHKAEILGYLESTANHEEILILAANLDSVQVMLNSGKDDQVGKYFKSSTTLLGELQTHYQVFLQAFLSFENYLADGFYLKKRAMLLKDKSNLLKLYNNLNLQRELQEEDLALIQKTFDANESLKKDKVISDFDYRNEESKLINKKLSLPQIKSGIISNESQQTEKEKEIMELENTIVQQKLVFQQALNTFKSQVDDWKRKYTLIAPIAGQVAFASFFQENQQLQANQTICFINPENSRYFVEITIPQSNFGKVAVGQQVLLKFQSYPFQEYGSVMGKIEFINHIPNEDGYLAKVVFMNGLTTTYNKQIQYRDGLLANAEIVTRDMRLLERFYYNIVRQMAK